MNALQDMTVTELVQLFSDITAEQGKALKRYPSMPVENKQTYEVSIPGTNVYVGSVWTEVSDDGLTVINRTLQGHTFFDGMVERRATQTAYGAW